MQVTFRVVGDVGTIAMSLDIGTTCDRPWVPRVLRGMGLMLVLCHWWCCLVRAVGPCGVVWWYVVAGLHNLRLVLISKFSQNFILKVRMLFFATFTIKMP